MTEEQLRDMAHEAVKDVIARITEQADPDVDVVLVNLINSVPAFTLMTLAARRALRSITGIEEDEE